MLSFAIALIVIMNPIGNLAIYIGLITGRDEQDCNYCYSDDGRRIDGTFSGT